MEGKPMKVYASSLVPTTPLPYLHLGYLSATTSNQHNSLKSVVPFFSVFTLLVITYLIIRKAPLWCILVTAIFAGTILTVMTTVSWVQASPHLRAANQHPQPVRYLYPDKVTDMRMAAISLMVAEAIHNGQSIPTDTNELPKTWKYEHKQNEDGWFHAFRIAKGKKVGELYIISSAGPDGRFGTLDDITRPVTRADVQELKRHVKETAR
ncbi:MAG: hypothetical protein ACYDBB_16055 [Armatimonadota bacterium]